MRKYYNSFFKISMTCSLLLLIFSCVACKKQEKITYSQETPETAVLAEKEPELDFVEMHNYVIDTISSNANPFFFVKDGKFDISGTNDPKAIKISCVCINGTVEQDVNLFFSLVLNNIGFNAAEQDFRYEKPKTDGDGTFISFGTIFNDYDLELHAENEDGTVIVDKKIKAGEDIPVDPRYWID